jgi:hypothetical protein
MTYAEYINLLQASYKMKLAVARKQLADGFSDGSEIMSYIIAEREAENAKTEWRQFFSRCVGMNLDLENEM